jgi:hypothetical protein
MKMMDTDGGTMLMIVMQEEGIPNSNNHLGGEEESGDDGASCASTEGYSTQAKRIMQKQQGFDLTIRH